MAWRSVGPPTLGLTLRLPMQGRLLGRLPGPTRPERARAELRLGLGGPSSARGMPVRQQPLRAAGLRGRPQWQSAAQWPACHWQPEWPTVVTAPALAPWLLFSTTSSLRVSELDFALQVHCGTPPPLLGLLLSESQQLWRLGSSDILLGHWQYCTYNPGPSPCGLETYCEWSFTIC